jgi:hypothetical protein
MSSIIIAAIIIGIIAFIIIILTAFHNKQKKKKTSAIVAHFNNTGMENNFSFSCQEILKNCIIGLDGLQRKLLILEFNENEKHKHIHIVDLNKVKHCGLQKIFSTIASSDKGKASEVYLEKIQLKFEYTNSNLPVEVIFYDHINNHIYEISEMEHKAKDWQNILNKLIAPSSKQIA